MIENVSTQLTVFHCFAHCLLPGRAFASLYALLFLEKEAEIGGRDIEDQLETKFKPFYEEWNSLLTTYNVYKHEIQYEYHYTVFVVLVIQQYGMGTL